MDFKIGDKVLLNSGSPELTVKKLTPKTSTFPHVMVEVETLDENDKVVLYEFGNYMLKKA